MGANLGLQIYIPTAGDALAPLLMDCTFPLDSERSQIRYVQWSTSDTNAVVMFRSDKR